MNIDALPIPKPYLAIHAKHWRTICRVVGIALAAQFFLSWGKGGWFVFDFVSMWSLIGGAGLTTLGFVTIPQLKRNHIIAIMGGVGFIGLTSALTAGGLPIPPMTTFGTLGMAAAVFALWRWQRNGYSQLVLFTLFGAIGSMALALLIPVMGELPLIFVFKVFGADGLNIVARIFLFLIAAGFIALAVFTVLFIALKKEDAEERWIHLFGAAWYVFIPVQYLLFGLVAGGGGLLAFLHITVMSLSYIFLIAYAGFLLLDAKEEGGLGSFFA